MSGQLITYKPDLTVQNPPTNSKLRYRQMYYEWALLTTDVATTDFCKHRCKPNQIMKLLEGIGATVIVLETGNNWVEVFCRREIARSLLLECLTALTL